MSVMKIPDPIHGCASIGCSVILLGVVIAIICAACGCASVPDTSLEARRAAWKGINTTVVGVPITNNCGTCIRFNYPDGTTEFRSRVHGSTNMWMTTKMPPSPVRKGINR